MDFSHSAVARSKIQGGRLRQFSEEAQTLQGAQVCISVLIIWIKENPRESNAFQGENHPPGYGPVST